MMRLASAAVLLVFAACGKPPAQEVPPMSTLPPAPAPRPSPSGVTALATFGNGCFWCTEAVFLEVEGVLSVISGYSGGHVDNPTYEQVCEKTTGHAEVVQIAYDPQKVPFDALLEIFFKTHDPTTLNRQGKDVGPQYRSAIFWHDEAQKKAAEEVKAALEKSGAWTAPIVTEIAPLKKFWKAEDYHQDYFRRNPTQGYCAFVVAPKVEKFRKVFKDRLKK